MRYEKRQRKSILDFVENPGPTRTMGSGFCHADVEFVPRRNARDCTMNPAGETEMGPGGVLDHVALISNTKSDTESDLLTYFLTNCVCKAHRIEKLCSLNDLTWNRTD